jgi:heme/copper-type cytochrome/quinol oxidase subunit 1
MQKVKLTGQLQADAAARYCIYVALGNMLIAAGSTIPMLIPELGLPLVIEQWPGTWMFIAYFILLICGVVGFVSWGVIYYLAPRIMGRRTVNKLLSLIHITFFEGSLLGVTAMMSLVAGFQGGNLLHDGFGQFIVTRTIEWVVIPIGSLIVVAILATLVGIFNLLLSPIERQ